MIFHFIPEALWRAAEKAGVYEADTLDRDGFIHCSTREQVARIADIVFPGRRDLVLLQIDPARVDVEVRYGSRCRGGEVFPHIHGPLNLDAVIEEHALRTGPDGRFVLPGGI